MGVQTHDCVGKTTQPRAGQLGQRMGIREATGDVTVPGGPIYCEELPALAVNSVTSRHHERPASPGQLL